MRNQHDQHTDVKCEVKGLKHCKLLTKVALFGQQSPRMAAQPAVKSDNRQCIKVSKHESVKT